MNGKDVVADLRARGVKLPRFHADLVERIFEPDIQIAGISLPRGSAKTWTMAQLAAQAITPGSPTFAAGVEVLGVSASLEQSRVLLQFVREALEAQGREGEFRWLDSSQRLAATHKASRARLRILSSSGRRAMGLANFSTIFADEPGAWEERGGALMYDALRTSLGKQPGQRLVLIGTRAPAPEGSWWPNLLDAGSGRGTVIEVRSAPDDEQWDAWATVAAVNPLLRLSTSLRKTVLRERDEARRSDALRPAYEAYRLNRQIDVRNEVLIDAAAWRRVEARAAPPREGRPILAVDVGAERSWSAAVLLFPNGRCEAVALCPGVPDLAERERQDAQPRGLYQKLHEEGALIVEHGKRMSNIETLVEHVFGTLGVRPVACLSDRFLLGQLEDALRGRCPLQTRKTRWSESTEDVAAFRRLALDGGLAIAPESRSLIRVSMGAAAVKIEEDNIRLQKRKGGKSRDDIAVALVLASGAMVRAQQRQSGPRWRYKALYAANAA